MKTFDGYSKEKFSDTSVLLAGGGSKELSNFIGTLNWDSTNRKLQYKKIGDTNWRDLVTFGSNATNSTAYLPLAGGTMTGLLATTYGSNNKGIKVGNTYINAIDGDLIFKNNSAIRFGGDSWDYNVWAGLKYVHSSKTIYLGLADGSAFTANSAQSDGKLYLPGITNIYTGNGTNLVWHAGNDGSGSGLDADLLDGLHSRSYLPYTVYDYKKGCLVKTDIPTASNTMVTFIIKGNSYDSNSIFTTGEFYNYKDSGQILSSRALHHGYNFGNITVFCYDGYVYMWFKQSSNFLSFIVTVYGTNNSLNNINRVTSITNADLPTTGITRKVEITPKISLNSSNYTSYTVKKDGTGASGTWGINISGNADTVDGYHANSFSLTNHTHTFASLTSKPTTLSGYSITDGLYSTQVSAAQDNVTWAKGIAKTNRRAFYYNTNGAEHSYLFGFSSSNTSSGDVNYGAVLKIGYTDSYLRILRVQGGNWKTTDWEKISAGYADSAGKWTTARTLTIGNTGKLVDGSANVSWSLAEIGASASTHTHSVKINGATKTIAASGGAAVDLGNYLPLSGGTMSGSIILKGSTSTDMTYDGNVHPYIRFNNADSTLNVSLIFTDYDSYRSPAGIKLIGNQGGEWFEAPNIYATNFYGNLSGNASSATKLTSSAGSATLPIYFSDGKPVACTASSLFSNLSNSGNNLSITIAGLNRTLTVGYASNSNTATYLNVQYCRDDSSPSDKGLWNTIKNGTTNTISNRVRFYTIYGTTTALGAPVNGNGELLEICSWNANHWQPLLWFGSGKDGRLYYRNKTYNDDSWGAWRTVAWTSDIPTVTNYYWANIPISATSNTGTNPTFASVTATNTVNATNYVFLNPNESGIYLNTSSINWHTNSSWTKNLLLFTSDGNVGVGTTSSPTQKLHVNGNAIATNFGVNASGGGNGISLYSGSGNVALYGIAFNQTSNWGIHGYVTSDWATYFTMNNLNNRGWIFRRNESGNIFSIDTSGLVYANGRINGNYFTSRVATGTLPYACASTTLNTNLNADLLDGYHETTFFRYRGDYGKSYTAASTEYNLGPGTYATKESGFTGTLLSFNSTGSTSGLQFWTYFTQGNLYYRTSVDSNRWGKTDGAWTRILDSDNYTTYTVKKDGTGASGTWNINISGNANTATSSTSSSYTRNLLGRNTSGSDFSATDENLVFSEWNTYSDNRWYLKAKGYETRVGYANGASYLYTTSIGSGSSSHASALQNYFNSYNSSVPRSSTLSLYSTIYDNGSQYIGYFLSGHDNAPYGGFFVAHYDSCYYVGIAGGNYNQQTIITSKNYSSYALPLSGGTMTAGARISHEDGNLYLGRADNNGWVLCQDLCSHSAEGDSYWSLRTNGTFHALAAFIDGQVTATQFNGALNGNAATATNADTVDDYHASSLITWKNLVSGRGALTWSEEKSGVTIYSHYTGHGLGSYRTVLACKDPSNSTGLEINAYWCVNPSDSAAANNIYYRVKRDAASDWGPYTKLLLSDGDATITGSYYTNSDIRYKSIQTLLLNKVNSIAELPIFTYYWNDNLHDDKLHIGSSAQAVKEVFPELVTYDESKDFYNLDYATLGTIAGITACKELVNLKSEIDLLKERIKELELQLKMINDYGRC